MTDIERKLEMIAELMKRKKNETAVKENDVYKVLLKAIDDSASPLLANEIKQLAVKMTEVEKQAPQYYQKALKSISSLAKDIRDTEARLNKKTAQNAQNTKQDIELKNKEIQKLIDSVALKTQIISEQLASIKLQHGKDGAPGRDGLPGKDGKDGKPGKNGKDGKDGENGRDGRWGLNGKSAYQYAKEAGYTGTEQEFSQALISGGGGTWGSIEGTLTDQTDLSEALAAKADTEDIPTAISELSEDTTHRTVTDTEKTTWNSKQDLLVSGTNLKTINGASVLGSGDIAVAASKTRKNFFIETDFLYNSTGLAYAPWNAAAISSGTLPAASTSVVPDHPGITGISSSTSANSGAYIVTTLTSFLLGGSEKTEYIFKTPTSINASTTVKLGFTDSQTASAPTDGLFVNIGSNSVSGKTYSNGSTSTTATSHTVDADTWYRASIELNSNATTATFNLFADNSETPLWTDTLSTNIPSGAGRYVGHGVVATNSGTTAVSLIYLDYMNLKIDRDLAR